MKKVDKVFKGTKAILDQFAAQYDIKKEYISVKYADLTPFFAIETTTLSKEEKSALLASIKTVGMLQPIIIADRKEILEGSHRSGIAQELGWLEGDAINLIGVPEGLKAIIAYQLNFTRRNAAADTKHTAFMCFESRIVKLIEGKTLNEGVKVLPDIARFFEKKKDGDQVLTKAEIHRVVGCFSGVSPITARTWRSENKAREKMCIEQPDIYSISSKIPSQDVRRFLQRKKQLKQNKDGSMLGSICGTMCRACDQQEKCELLRVIYNRRCTVEANHKLIAKMCDAPVPPKGEEKHYSNPKMVLAEYYRRRKAIALSDKAWENSMLPRVLKEAQKLYEACSSNLDIARFCIEQTAMRLEANGPSWSLTAVLKDLKKSERVWNEQHPNQAVSLTEPK